MMVLEGTFGLAEGQEGGLAVSAQDLALGGGPAPGSEGMAARGGGGAERRRGGAVAFARVGNASVRLVDRVAVMREASACAVMMAGMFGDSGDGHALDKGHRCGKVRGDRLRGRIEGPRKYAEPVRRCKAPKRGCRRDVEHGGHKFICWAGPTIVGARGASAWQCVVFPCRNTSSNGRGG